MSEQAEIVKNVFIDGVVYKWKNRRVIIRHNDGDQCMIFKRLIKLSEVDESKINGNNGYQFLVKRDHSDYAIWINKINLSPSAMYCIVDFYLENQMDSEIIYTKET